MKLKHACGVAGALLLSVPVVAGAAPSTLKVTGGGQSITEGKDTIGFNAQTDGTTHKGQVQFVDRADDGTQTQYHGSVTCVVAATTDTPGNEGAAYIVGVIRHIKGDAPAGGAPGFFSLYVEDNGEPNQGRDLMLFETHADNPNCEPPDNPETLALAHGNVQFHKSNARKRKRAAAPKVVSLAGLR